MAAIDYRDLPQSELVKIVYGEYQDEQFVKDSVVYGMIQKFHNFVGKQKEVAVQLSIGAGVGNGVLPEASGHDVAKAIITSKKMYARQELDNESIEATKDPMGAFASFLKEYDTVTKQAFAVNVERQIILNDAAGLGALASGDPGSANVDGTGASNDPYVVQLAPSTNMYAFEEGYLVNVNLETTPLKVVAVDEATKTVSLEGTSVRLTALTGSGPFASTDSIFMQNSRGLELAGLNGVLRMTPADGSYKNIRIGRRWQAHQTDATASPTDRIKHLNATVTKIQVATGGKSKPDLILMSPTQYTLFLDQLEDVKSYEIRPSDSRLAAKVGYDAIQYHCSAGMIPVTFNRFVPEDTIMILNTKKIEWHDRHAPKWLDRDGTILGRRENADAYEARYGCYGDLLINPFFQGIIFNLSTTA